MQPESVSQDDKNLSLLAHLLGLITGFVGPLIIWLVKKDSAFVQDQAKEALNFQITLIIAYVACWILAFVLIGFVLMGVVGIVDLILVIMAAMAASRGERYRYPVALRLLK